jgi:hypothetical protein
MSDYNEDEEFEFDDDDDFDYIIDPETGETIDPETGEPMTDDMDLGMIKFGELKGICERHIENGRPAFSEDEFNQIVRWFEETRMNQSMLTMVLEGTLDIVFDEDKLDDIEEDGLLFTLSNKAKAQLDEENESKDIDLTNGGFLDLDFEKED